MPDFWPLFLNSAKPAGLHVWAFDLLALNSKDLRKWSPDAHQGRLQAPLSRFACPAILASKAYADGEALLRVAEKHGLEGVVSKEDDARRFWGALRARLEEFALSLHSDKTRVIEFGRHAADRRARAGLGKPETFTFLGFLFVCGKSRRGQFLVHRKSRHDRMQAKLKEVKQELRKRMHQPIPEQGRWLAQVVRGYFAYHAVPTNRESIGALRRYVVRL